MDYPVSFSQARSLLVFFIVWKVYHTGLRMLLIDSAIFTGSAKFFTFWKPLAQCEM